MKKYWKNEEFKNEYNKNYNTDEKGNVTKKNLKKGEQNLKLTDNEKTDIKEILKHYGITGYENTKIQTKHAAYKILKDNFDD